MAIRWSEEQLLAINKENSNIIVSAGAGSGKTAVLTTRIERKLLEGCKVEQLLVLTFTNAAAAEMKERVLKKMNKNEQLKERIDEIDHAYITTFDSYSLSVVKKYHYRLNISKNISIVDACVLNVYKRNVLDEILNDYYEKQDPRFEKLLRDLTLKSDKPIRSSMFRVAESLELLSDKATYLKDFLEKYDKEETFAKYIADLETILLRKIVHIQENLIKMKDDDAADLYYGKCYSALDVLIHSKTYDEIRFNCMIRLPSLPKDYPYKHYKEEIASTLKDIQDLCIYTNESYAKDVYLNSKEYLEIIVEIILKFSEKIQCFKHENEVFEFIDIAKMAISLVKENQDIREEIKSSFKEILIDEYQDTSNLQEEFISYIANNNVYMVGDIKQSIYRFRNANPSIFKEKYDAYSNNNGGIKIDLNKNFRSNHEALDFINTIFCCIMDKQIGNADFLKGHQMRYGLTTYNHSPAVNMKKINYLVYDNSKKKYKNADIEMFIVLRDIQRRLDEKEIVYDKDLDTFRPCEYRDFAILISSSSSFESIRDLLEYNHIPTAIVKNEEVSNGIIVQLLLNVVKIITLDYKQTFDEEFFRCFYGIGRSFLLEMKDEELFDYVSLKTFKDSKLYGIIHELSGKIMTHSLKEMIQMILDEFDVINKLIKIGNVRTNLTRIQFMIKIAQEIAQLSLTIFDFVEYVDDIFENQEKLEFPSSNLSENKVKIMTIHKSKGLEFPIVYFINNYKLFNKEEMKDKIIFDETYGIITPFNDHGEGKNITYLLMKEKNNIEMVSEEVRLLYVALTRARENMIIINPQNIEIATNDEDSLMVDLYVREKYNSFKAIYQSVDSKLEPFKTVINLDSLGINDLYHQKEEYDYKKLIKKVDKKIVHFENKDHSIEIKALHASKSNESVVDKKKLLSMQEGTHLHEIFECIDFKKPTFNNLKPNEAKIINNFLNQPILKMIEEGKVYKELEFITKKDETTLHGIIDLLIEYDDHIDIIDYKMKNIIDEHYVSQLKQYQHYIEEKRKKKTRLYLYSMIRNEMVEVGEVHV